MRVYRKKARIIRPGSKKGSYIMEAAIVLPMIVMTVITVVLIIMFFYSQVTERSRMHVAMRHEAGAATGKAAYTDESKACEAELYSEKTITGSRVYGKRYLMMDHKGILERKGISVLEGSCSGADGAGYVRYHSFVKGMKNE